MLLAGTGKSTIQAGAGDALIIGGTTEYDANDLALAAILDEWASADSFSTRQTKLASGFLTAGGINMALNASTVRSNEQGNSLQGNSPANNDLFFANLTTDPDTVIDADVTTPID